jgi:hypothetical protein
VRPFVEHVVERQRAAAPHHHALAVVAHLLTLHRRWVDKGALLVQDRNRLNLLAPEK